MSIPVGDAVGQPGARAEEAGQVAVVEQREGAAAPIPGAMAEPLLANGPSASNSPSSPRASSTCTGIPQPGGISTEGADLRLRHGVAPAGGHPANEDADLASRHRAQGDELERAENRLFQEAPRPGGPLPHGHPEGLPALDLDRQAEPAQREGQVGRLDGQQAVYAVEEDQADQGQPGRGRVAESTDGRAGELAQAQTN